MSLTKILPYFRTCLCDLGYEEWVTESESEEPPNQSIEDYFRLRIGSGTFDPVRHTSFPLTIPVEVNLYFNTHNDFKEGMDRFMEKTELALCKILSVNKRYGPEIKSIAPTGLRPEPIDGSNDNTVKAVLDFDVRLELEFKE